MSLFRGSAIVGLILNGIFLHYITDLEKHNCKCSESWQRHHIKYHVIAITLINVITLIKPDFIVSPFMKTVLPILGILTIVFVYSLLTWTRQLRHEKCECSENWKRTLMEYYSYFVIGSTLLQVSAMMVLLFQLNRLLKTVKTK